MRRVLVAALFMMVWWAGCAEPVGYEASSATGGPVQVANLTVPLESVALSGQRYRLLGDIQIADMFDNPLEVLHADGADRNVSTALAAGSYMVTLLPGWSLMRVEDVLVPVEATLVSGNPTWVSVADGTVARIPLTFALDEELFVLDGAARLDLEVDLLTGPEPDQVNALCGAGPYCLYVELDIMPNAVDGVEGGVVPMGLAFDVLPLDPLFPGTTSRELMVSALNFGAGAAGPNLQDMLTRISESMMHQLVSVQEMNTNAATPGLAFIGMDAGVSLSFQTTLPVQKDVNGDLQVREGLGQLLDGTLCDTESPVCLALNTALTTPAYLFRGPHSGL